ncbi:MAG: hypothetical protein IT197_04935 [Acidimicrobiia bacterium]|nr:hypothetical protein [Acidimicrobiia bacterium]
MTIDERHRLALAEAAKRVLGDDPAVTLMELLPPVGWADVATRRDLDSLRTGLQAEIAVLRGEMHREIGELRGEIGGLRGEIGRLQGEIGGLQGEIGGLQGEIGGLRGELRSEMAALSRRLVLWLVTTVFATFAASLAVRLA